MKRNLMGAVMSLILLFVSASVSVLAMDGPPGRGGKMGPPPEAIEACKDKTEGDAVEFITPRGDKVKAICRMTALPENFAGDDERKGPKGPIGKAIEACKDKTEGDAVEFITPSGDKVKATCRMMALPEDFVR